MRRTERGQSEYDKTDQNKIEQYYQLGLFISHSPDQGLLKYGWLKVVKSMSNTAHICLQDDPNKTHLFLKFKQIYVFFTKKNIGTNCN